MADPARKVPRPPGVPPAPLTGPPVGCRSLLEYYAEIPKAERLPTQGGSPDPEIEPESGPDPVDVGDGPAGSGDHPLVGPSCVHREAGAAGPEGTRVRVGHPDAHDGRAGLGIQGEHSRVDAGNRVAGAPVLHLVLAARPALYRPDQGECARQTEERPGGEGRDVAGI